MSRKLKARKTMTRSCSIEGGRFLVNECPVDVSPLLVTMVLLKDGETPSDDYGYVPQRTAETILRMAAFISAQEGLATKRKGEKA